MDGQTAGDTHRRGHREACETFVRRHYAPVYRLLVRLCRDANLAEDLSQETFAAAWSNIDTYAGASSLATWLHRIAYRKFLDWRRARSWPAAEGDIHEVACRGTGPVEAAMLEEESRVLRQALGRLPAAERDVLVLHYMQGLSYREMARVLAHDNDLHGAMLRFEGETAAGDWSGYAFASREAIGPAVERRPLLLVVEPEPSR